MPANLGNSAVATWLEKVSFPSNPKERQWECSNYNKIALISHSSKVMLKILQATLQQYMNFHMFKLNLEKAEEPEIKLPTSAGSSKKQQNSRKTFTSVSLTMLKLLTVWITTNHGKFLKRWEYQTPYLPPEISVYRSRTGHGTMDWLQIGKGVWQDCILSSCLFNLYAEYIMQNTRRDEAQAGIKIAGKNINNVRYANATTLMAEAKRN